MAVATEKKKRTYVKKGFPLNAENLKKGVKMKNYKFEWNDLRAVTTLVNVVLIMIYGLSISWFGLVLAILGIIKDVTDKLSQTITTLIKGGLYNRLFDFFKIF